MLAKSLAEQVDKNNIFSVSIAEDRTGCKIFKRLDEFPCRFPHEAKINLQMDVTPQHLSSAGSHVQASHNRQLCVGDYCSTGKLQFILLDPCSSGIDALAQGNWREHNNFINPPFALIPRVLNKIVQERAVATLTAPQGKQGIWLFTFADRENTGNLVNLIFYTGKILKI